MPLETNIRDYVVQREYEAGNKTVGHFCFLVFFQD